MTDPTPAALVAELTAKEPEATGCPTCGNGPAVESCSDTWICDQCGTRFCEGRDEYPGVGSVRADDVYGPPWCEDCDSRSGSQRW